MDPIGNQISRLISKTTVMYTLYQDIWPTREMWVHDLILHGSDKSEFLLAEEILESPDEEKCHQYFRMQKYQFEYLLNKVESLISKKDTFWRSAIPAKRRLILTIRYLATGASQLDLAFSFRIGHSTVGTILRETMSALWKELVNEVMPPPSPKKWLEIAKEFNFRWQCPNCIGALDGKHVRIKCPPNSGSEFYNYKGYFSIVLLAVCDAQYRFVIVDIGNSGRHSDGGVFSNSRLGKGFDQSILNIPGQQTLPGTSESIPLYFAADDAFPLKIGIMKPYPGRALDRSQKIFNYRLSRARRIVENTFGILAARWQVFFKTINCDPELATLRVEIKKVV
uniref:protein ALP1-like n=1 Tax=Styela clava TaxID=7725 RepID=UPI00193A4B5B|nr:protein ALP1-like [Styela clava]